MKDRVGRQTRAFRQALWFCKHYGLNWKTNIGPKIERREITGYYILDETFSTAVAEILI